MNLGLQMNNHLTHLPLSYRSQKIAYTLLSHIGHPAAAGYARQSSSSSAGGGSSGETWSVKPGDRVALVYPNSDPLNFMCSFYGCILAGMVPVPIEVPVTRRDAGSQQIGFLLGSCGVTVALTSDACYKGLPKNASGEVISFKGWPRLHWFITEHLQKPPRDWMAPPRLTDDTPAYVEYTTQPQDGSVLGVTVSRAAMLGHARTLTAACNYTEGEICVCVLDFKREVSVPE